MLHRVLVVLVLSLWAVFMPDRVALAQRQVRAPGISGTYSPLTWANKSPLEAGFFRLPGIGPDYKVGAEDELEIFITAYSDSSISVRVSNSGEISIPLVGVIDVQDLTTTELEERIAAKLAEKQLIEKPEVLVHVAEHAAHPIFVIGEVDNPGQYMMSHQLTLMEAIFLAGGIDFTAGRYGYLHRRTAPTTGPAASPGNLVLENPERAMPGTTVTRVDLQPLQDGNVLEPDIPLRRGDVFVVPARAVEMFYVIGDVVRAGAFPIPAQRSLRISQALAYTGGPSRSAKLSGGKVIRLEADGQRRELPIDFRAIMQGEKEDFDVKPNDVIFVPGAQFKNVSTGVLGSVPGLMMQAALLF